MRRMLSVVLIALLASQGVAHEGEGHSEEELQQEEHSERGDFGFVSGEYPSNSRGLVATGVALTSFLFMYAVYHFFRRRD